RPAPRPPVGVQRNRLLSRALGDPFGASRCPRCAPSGLAWRLGHAVFVRSRPPLGWRLGVTGPLGPVSPPAIRPAPRPPVGVQRTRVLLRTPCWPCSCAPDRP